ncbi:MAG: Na/Pi symporter [Pseudomonadota bacterium]
MSANVLVAIGGIGLFLIGMLVLTEGLRTLAGAALRKTLTRLTKTPLSGAAAGAFTTAVVQSSSATTVTAVGFVGAGLLTFPQALGIIFGANIGTTITGWLVALIGFKLDLGMLAPPLLLIGALLRLFAGGRAAQIGWSLAGFSLLFLGIDAMKTGLAGFEGTVTPASFPDDTLFGRLQLVLIGVAITLVTQSSSAGVATALVALSAGTISLPQAAALVIGMDVGTTATALLAALGGSTAMRRTGYAHVLYNVMTGTLAFLLLTPFAWIAGAVGSAEGDAQIALVAFHTFFNALGVVVVLPFANPFARLIERLVPEHETPMLRRLDRKLLNEPAAAIDAASATLSALSHAAFANVGDSLRPRLDKDALAQRRAELAAGIDALRTYLEQVRTGPEDPYSHRRHVAAMHALDHLSRLHQRCCEIERIEALPSEPRLARLAAMLGRVAGMGAQHARLGACEATFDRVRQILRAQRDQYRARTVEAAAAQRIDAETVLARLDGIRWLHRVSYHLWRIAHHLERVTTAEPPPAPASEASLENEAD